LDLAVSKTSKDVSEREREVPLHQVITDFELRYCRCVSQITKYNVDTLKAKHYVLCIANYGKTANNYMFRPLSLQCICVSRHQTEDTLYLRLRWSRGSLLAFGTQVRGLTPGRSRRIFRAKKSSARLPSEGK
jgi:hypothetical protein